MVKHMRTKALLINRKGFDIVEVEQEASIYSSNGISYAMGERINGVRVYLENNYFSPEYLFQSLLYGVIELIKDNAIIERQEV